AGRSRACRHSAGGDTQPQARGRRAVRAAVRLSRLPTRMRRWWAADAPRPRGRITRRHPERVAALPSAQGTSRHSLRRLATPGWPLLHGRPGGKTARVSLTAAGRQKALTLAGSDASGESRESNNRLGAVPWPTERGRGADTAPTHRRSVTRRQG